MLSARARSQHFLDESVDKFFSVSVGSEPLGESVSFGLESSKWGGELEWPQEVVSLLEVWSASYDFVNEIFDTVNTVSCEFSSNDAVISEWNSSSLNLSVSSLVDQIGN